MGRKIDVEVRIDPACTDPHVVITAESRSDLIDRIESAIERCIDEDVHQFVVYDGESIVMIERGDIIRVFTDNRRLTVCTVKGEFRSRQTLLEFEESLDSEQFIRISRFEIVNLGRVRGFDMSTSGTIRVAFEDGSETWVARRYIKSIHDRLNDLRKNK